MHFRVEMTETPVFPTASTHNEWSGRGLQLSQKILLKLMYACLIDQNISTSH